MTTAPPPSDDWCQTSAALRRVARTLVADAAAADDVAQSTLVTALRRPPRLLSWKWLERVLRHRAADHRRDERRRRDHIEKHGPGSLEAQDTAHIAEQLESFSLLTEAVRRLRAEYQQVIFWRYFDDLTPRQIAKRQGIPIKTVKTRLHRALRELRADLDRRYSRGIHALVAPLLGAEYLAPVSTVSAVTVLAQGGLMLKRSVAVVAVLVLGVCGVLVVAELFDTPAAAPGELPTNATATLRAGAPDRPDATGARDTGVDAVERSAVAVAASPAARRSSPTGCSLVVQAVWTDGTPAPDIAITVRPWVYRPQLELREVTGENGVVRFEDLAAGKLVLSSDRGGRQEVEIAVGEQREVRFEIEPGAEVAGRVIDASGRPVPGASIWLTTRRTGVFGGRVVTRADASGSFTIRSVPKDQSLGAIRAGHAPSELVDLDELDVTTRPVRVELVLRAGGGSLQGTVYGSDGRPAAYAEVSVGASPVRHPQRNSGRAEATREVWTPRTARTDGHGRYALEGLDPGAQPIHVRDGDHAVWRGEVAVDAGGHTTFDVHLPAPATVHGVVTDVDGEPESNAIVCAIDIWPEHMFLSLGQIDYDEPFGYPSAFTNEDGAFHLDRVPPGEVTLLALRRTSDAEARLHRRLEREIAPGALLEWNPVLDPGHTIHGVVTFRSGEPLTGMVMARSSNGGQPIPGFIDRKGRFRFVNLEATHYSLSVDYYDAPEGAKPLVKHNVRPGADEVLLIAPYDKPREVKLGTVRLRVEDASGRLAHAEALGVILSRGSSWRPNPDRDGDAFVFKRMKPGRLLPIVMSGEEVIAVGEWFELGEGEDVDLGTIVTEPGGSARIRLDRRTGAESIEVRLHARPADGSRARRIDFGTASEIEVDNLSPGEYTVHGRASGMVDFAVPLTVEAGRRAELEVAINGAGDVTFELAFPADVGDIGAVDIEVRDANGAIAHERTIRDSAAIRRPYRSFARLALGEYLVTAKTGTGLTGSADFMVSQYGPGAPAVRIEMR